MSATLVYYAHASRRWLIGTGLSMYSLLLFSCGNADTNATTTATKPATCTTPQKITAIYKPFVYDLSGYEHSGGGSPFNLFDEDNFTDPKTDITTYPETSPHPIRNAEIYFPKGRGSRIVVDLRVPYKLSEVYLYDRSVIPDTVWVYTGDMQNWKLKQTIITNSETISWGWRKFALSDTSRFVQFRFNSRETTITEAALYGCPLQPVPPAPAGEYSGPRLPRKPMKDFLGVNMYNESPMEWLQPFKWVRMYADANLFDTDAADAYPGNKINISRLGYLYQGQYFRHFSDDLAAVGKNIWYSVKGVPAWMNKLGLWEKDRPLTRLGMNPEDPMSYGRHAYLMWTLAAVFGKTAVDTSLLNIADMIKVSGKGTMTLFENGNEEDAWWKGDKYCTPVEYFAQSSADYDGHLHKLGDRHGIATADSNSKLILSGTVGLDTNRVRVLDFLCQYLRPDKKFLWQGGIQYHHYSTNVRSSIAPNRFQQATAGITPEEDSLRSRLAKVRDFTYRLQPGIECILGEYGFDKGPSAQSTPIIPGYTPAQSQGIMLVRSINAVAFSGFDRLILYWMKDHEPVNSPHIYLTSGLIYQSMDGQITPYPSWFHVNTMMHHLADYVPENIISEKGNVWIYKYRHQTQKDSVALFVYAPTRKGNKYPGYALNAGVGSGRAVEISFEDKREKGRKEEKDIKGGKIIVDVDEVPKIILFSER
ncbi:MAG TPA: hypothetical protein VD993_08465 [Chitinophagaceae bacterium]|nr:hypothetical protein [Chitinophagaceae bacterium]